MAPVALHAPLSPVPRPTAATSGDEAAAHRVQQREEAHRGAPHAELEQEEEREADGHGDEEERRARGCAQVLAADALLLVVQVEVRRARPAQHALGAFRAREGRRGRRTGRVGEARLADAKSEASRLIDEARGDAERVRADLVARAEADAAGIRERAAAESDAAKAQAIADLRTEVAAIALGAAERVVQSSLDAEVQGNLIDAYIDEVAGTDG